MIKKLQEHHQKLDQLKQSQTPKNDIKQLLKDRRKERLESATLPNFAKVVDDQLEVRLSTSY
jgi:translation elongation factor EF-Ts